MDNNMEVWVEGEKIFLTSSQIKWVTDRSRIVEGRGCKQKRYLKYQAGPGGCGIDTTFVPEDFLIGSAVHKGVEEILKGKDIYQSSLEAYNYYLSHGVRFEEDDLVKLLGGDVTLTLRMEQAFLSQALTYAWGKVYWEVEGDRWEVLDTEGEINWVLSDEGEGFDTSRYGVVMSRPDGVWRDKVSGKVYVISFKTTKDFTTDTFKGLEVDPQKMFEGKAVEQKYGRCDGVLYFYLKKSKKYPDANLGRVSRYTSPLIRPWVNNTFIGELGLEHFRMQHEWVEGDKTRKLGKDWVKVNIWDLVDIKEWLEALVQDQIDSDKNLNWLESVVSVPPIQEWDSERVSLWLEGVEIEEGDWMIKSFMQESLGKNPLILFPQNTGNCFSYFKPCMFYNLCWGGGSIEDGFISKKWKVREPNHKQEVMLND